MSINNLISSDLGKEEENDDQGEMTQKRGDSIGTKSSVILITFSLFI